MRLTNLARAAALALALSGCGANDDTDAIANVPDAEGLTLELQGGAAEGLAAAGVSKAALEATPSPDDDGAAAQEKIAAVNTAIRSMFAHLAEVAKAGGTEAPGGVTLYGPVDRCVVEGACDAGGTATFRLRVFRSVGTAWAFSLEALVDDAWKPVAAGWMRRGPMERRGAGRVALNLENLRAAAPAYAGQGYLLGGFASGPVVKNLSWALRGFTPDPAAWPATTAAFRGFKTASGATRIRVATIADLYGPAGSETELGFAHVAYHPVVGGRAYALVSNHAVDGVTVGDVPATDAGAPQYFFGRACSAPGQTAPVFKEWFLCPRALGPRACVVAQGGVGEQVVGDPGATWASACAVAVEPLELAPPAEPPAGSPDDAGAEDGEEETGLEPPAPPADVNDVTPPAT